MTERAWHALSAENTATEWHVDIGVGLGEAEAATRLVAHGPNALVATKPASALHYSFISFAVSWSDSSSREDRNHATPS